ncbi:hypothetical protein [Streptomyces sp. NPDC047046]|uniref:hypothetical protein n=1 Tax=unclassified Streptomyces TaxID=2593676 RepID=UPI0033DD9193
MRRPTLPPLGGPLPLLLTLCSLAVSAYAAVRLLAGDWLGVALWIVGAALLHDLVLVPLYTTADRLLVRPFAATGHRRWAGHVRVPAALSLLLLLVWFPLISGRVDGQFRSLTGRSTDPYLGHWLLITAALFAVSAVVFVVRVRRAAKRRPSADH